jgi:DNA replication and repair protein RecF
MTPSRIHRLSLTHFRNYRTATLQVAGDMVVLVAGRPLGHARSSNTLALYRVGEPTTGYIGH